MASDRNDDDKVGYKKPPRDGRFKKGQSGNPRGRRKGSKNISTLLTDAMLRRVTLTVNGQVTTMPVLDALAIQSVNSAVSGNFRHIRLLLENDCLESSEPFIIYFEKGDENI